MTEPKTKDETISVGAKTFVEKLAKQFVYGYTETFSSKYCDKGIEVEDQSIELYNSVFGSSYVKNTERKTNNWISGECDIFATDKIIDIKSPWSLSTFPATAEDGKDKTYEWQIRAYMMLWDVDFGEVAYCLVNTPPRLVGYEEVFLHSVDHITPALRVTRLFYERDKSLEDKIKTRCKAANLYLDVVIERIAAEHTYTVT